MLRDPLAGGNSGFPYDLLAEAGVNPGSTMKEILDASFLLMEQNRWSPEVRRAWDELRTVERRLVVDFLHYGVAIGTLCDFDWERRDSTLDALDAPDTDTLDQLPPLPGADVVEFDQ